MGILYSCNEDIKIWDSNNYDYSGSYVYKIADENGKIKDDISTSAKLEFYNTATDELNELWIWDHGKRFPLKSRVSLNGKADSFKAKTLEFKELTNNLLAIEDIFKYDLDTPPSSATEETVVTASKFRCAILDGKILKGMATSKSGNTVDSIYLQIQFYGADVKFQSYLVPVKERVNPKVDEFKWKLVDVTANNTKDEKLTISGYRYTGFLEDED